MRKMSIVILMTSCLHAQGIQKASTPVVSCNLYGQLGNQLFQIAPTLAYAWDYGAKPIFSELNHQDYRISNNRSRIFFRLDASEARRAWKASYEASVCSTERIPFQLNSPYPRDLPHYKTQSIDDR